jgi:hypothetical protein
MRRQQARFGRRLNAMNHPILLRVVDFAEATDAFAGLAERFGARFAGIEYVLPASAPVGSIVAVPLAPADRRGGDDPCPVLAIATGCREVQLDSAVEAVTNLLQLASRAGVTVLNLRLPPLALASESTGFARYQDALNFTYQLLRGLGLQAESTGVVIAVEAAYGRWLLSPVELRELLDAANSWAIGACIDLARVSAVGAPIDWITTLTHRIKAVRWNFGPTSRDSIDSHEARVDPLVIKDALDAIVFRGPIIIPHEHARADWVRILSGESCEALD